MSDFAVLILAAGASSRSAPSDKLQFNIDGQPMLRHVVQTYQDAKVGDIFVVTGGIFADQRRGLLEGFDVNILEFQLADQGMGASIAFGISQLPNSVQTVLIALADMPRIDRHLIVKLINLHKEGSITAPSFNGKRGHPVLFDRKFFSELIELEGDQGARTVIEKNRAKLHCVEDEFGFCLFDLDT